MVMDMKFLEIFTKNGANRRYFIICLGLCFFIGICRTLSQEEHAVVSSPGVHNNPTTQSSSETNVFRKGGSCRDNDEGPTRNRSRFPEDPDVFKPMPIPDPTKKPPKPSGDNPELPTSHVIKEGEIGSSENVDERR